MFQTNVIEKIKIHILYSITLLRKSAVNEIISKNVVEPERPQMTTQYGACALHAG